MARIVREDGAPRCPDCQSDRIIRRQPDKRYCMDCSAEWTVITETRPKRRPGKFFKY